MLEEGYSGTGDRDAEVGELVGVVSTLREHEAAVPRAEFSYELRTRLLAEADRVHSDENAALLLPARQRGPRERRLVAAASAAVFIGGTATMAAAAQSALPGEALYPVKRGVERVDASLSMSEAGKGRDLLDQARTRLGEVEELLDSDSVQSAPQVHLTLADFSAQAGEGSALLFDSFRETADPETVRTVRTFTNEAMPVLAELSGQVPADAEDELSDAALTLRDIDEDATALCGSCLADMPTVDVPSILLARAEVNRALQTAMSNRLDNSHPVVVPKGALGARAAPVENQRERAAGSDPDQPTSDRPESGAGPTQAPPEEPAVPDVLPELPEQPADPGGNVTEDGPGRDKPRVRTPEPDKVTDGLRGSVETLLPNPNPNPKPEPKAGLETPELEAPELP